MAAPGGPTLNADINNVADNDAKMMEDSDAALSLAEQKKSEGNDLYKEGQYAAAVSLYNEAIAVCPVESRAPFYGNRSAAYLMMKDYTHALNDCMEAVRLDPTYAKGYARAAKIHTLRGEYDQALKMLTQQTSRSTTPASLQEMANVNSLAERLKLIERAFEQGSHSSALMHTQSLLKESPESSFLKVMQADCMIQLQQFEKAKTLCAAMYQADQRNSEVIRVHGLTLYYTGNMDLAQKCFSEVLRFDPDNKKCLVLFKRIRKLESKKAEGNAAFQSGRALDAINAYTEALDIDKLNKEFNSTLYSNRAAAYMKLKRWQEALTDCTRCLELKPSFVKAKVRRAQCCLELKQYDEAIRYYDALCKSDPENAEYRSQLKHAKLELKKSKRKDYYAILGVAQSASSEEIKKAYRKAALRYHPDRQQDDAKKAEAERKFKDLNEANEVLSDEQKRRRYDSGVDLEDDEGPGGHGMHNMNDIFSMFFSQGGMGGMGGMGGHGHHGHGGGFGRTRSGFGF